MSGVPDEVEELIDGAALMANLATSVDDRPHVAPVWYHYEDGTVEVTTTGRKLRNIRQNSRVAVSIQRATDGDARWMVTMLGTATVIDDEERTREAAARINGKYGADADDYAGNTLVRIDVGTASWQRYDE